MQDQPMLNQEMSQKSSVKASSKKKEAPIVAVDAASLSQVSGTKATGRWTREEHYRFLEALKIHGKEWRRV